MKKFLTRLKGVVNPKSPPPKARIVHARKTILGKAKRMKTTRAL